MTAPAAGPPARLSRGRAIGWSVLFLGLGFFLTILLAFGASFALASITGQSLTETAVPTPGMALLQGVAGLAGFGLATYLVGVRVLRLSAADLRWHTGAAAGRGVLLGLLLGALPAAGVIGLSVLVGNASFTPDEGHLGDYAGRVGLTFLVLAPAALLEEVAFRGVAQVVLANVFGRWPALLALSLLFGVAHSLNPDPTLLALVNIALAGVFLAVAFYLPGGIWTAWGAHLGWNATLAAFDAPVSGLPFDIPFLDYQPGGPPWLTGGGFGPEGGLLATLGILAVVLILSRRMEPVRHA